LIVERHPLMREALCAAIDEEPDLTVAGETAHVAEALLVAASLAPDVFLISLDEPDPEAVAAMGVLRRAQPAARILALTSEEVTGRESDILNGVAHAVLTKATPRAELVHAIRRIAAVRRTATVR
jgi:DNA-binding NarL/FixJ family response regulator